MPRRSATRTPHAADCRATGRVEAEPRMDVGDVAKGVVYMASLSLEANVQFMTVMATKMPYIGRG
jgi:NADP-dependent 3-hydroxy acid dehydrogenase YdfG